ncbi:hypothetical protein [Algoriphagus sp.]|uniref:hypothetical protein n=1 Tax=Algoriphagus sp. TaxID=1872435 RepID=UPI0026249E07|nr:hypothetical protein [Algoriphagus sp.]
MKKNNRREFLKSGSIATSLLALAPIGLGAGKSLLKVKVPNSTNQIQVLHSAGLKGQIEPLDSIGGLRSIQELRVEKSAASIYLDSGNFLTKDVGFERNLAFLRNLVSSGLTLATLGKQEMEFPSNELQKLIQESKVKILGNNLEGNGLILGETYFTRAIITSGKYRVGVLPVSGASLGSLTSKALELKLFYQCDLVVALGNPSGMSFSEAKNYFGHSHQIDHFLVDDEFFMPLGTRVVHSKKGKEIWVSRPADLGRFVGNFQYQFNSAYEICQLSNHSCIPGKASNPQKMAFLHQFSAQNLV